MGGTKRFCNYINMGLIFEKHNIQNILDTANIIDEIKDTDKKLIKKVYNLKLIDKLER